MGAIEHRLQDDDPQETGPTDAPLGSDRAVPAELSNADLMSLPAIRMGLEVPFEERTSWSGADLKDKARDPLVGTTLHDTYVVSRVLGAGGMGRVYEAHHTRIRTKRYALKVLHPEFSQNPEIRLRFQREAEAAATIEHDGVVGTYDIGQTPQGWPYMVCEYLSGKDLNDYLKHHGVLSPQAVVHVGRQLCSALRVAHTRGVIHRDLKPHNIFVLEQGDGLPENERIQASLDLPFVKVLDFGLSRFVENDSGLTKAGIILGTPGYMAPEQAHGHETDARTDIYGIGALLYASATGKPPFSEETPQLTVLAVMNREPPRPRELSPDIPVALEIVIQKAMARDPAARYQSAAEMGAALTRLYEATSPLNRRDRLRTSGPLASPRVAFGFLAAVGVSLTGTGVAGAAVAAMELIGFDYRHFSPSTLEWLLLVLLGLFVLFPLALAVRAFRRRVWGNSARVADLNVHLRQGLLVGVLGYGITAWAFRGTSAMDAIAIGSLQGVSNGGLWPWIVLPANALIASAVAVTRSALGDTNSRFVRILARALLPIFGVGLACALLTLPWSSRHPKAESTILTVPQPGSSTDVAAKAGPNREAPDEVPSSDGELHAPPAEAAPSADAAETVPTSPKAALTAPRDELMVAAAAGSSALEELRKRFPEDPKLLKALVLAHASRADTLNQSVQTAGQLLKVAPTMAKDPDVLFILKRALRMRGAVFQSAAAAIKAHMGEEGAELVYQMLTEHPEQRSLRDLFQDLRQAKTASKAVLLAYDLRNAPSCRGRLDLLDDAEKYGDMRSVRQLQALSTAPKHCGGWGRICYPPCRVEAARFQQSAKAISKRLNEEKARGE